MLGWVSFWWFILLTQEEVEDIFLFKHLVHIAYTLYIYKYNPRIAQLRNQLISTQGFETNPWAGNILYSPNIFVIYNIFFFFINTRCYYLSIVLSVYYLYEISCDRYIDYLHKFCQFEKFYLWYYQYSFSISSKLNKFYPAYTSENRYSLHKNSDVQSSVSYELIRAGEFFHARKAPVLEFFLSFMITSKVFSGQAREYFKYNFWVLTLLKSYLLPVVGTALNWLILQPTILPDKSIFRLCNLIWSKTSGKIKYFFSRSVFIYTLVGLLTLETLTPFINIFKRQLELTPAKEFNRLINQYRFFLSMLFSYSTSHNIFCGYLFKISGRLTQGRAAKKRRIRICGGKYSVGFKKTKILSKQFIIRTPAGIIGGVLSFFYFRN